MTLKSLTNRISQRNVRAYMVAAILILAIALRIAAAFQWQALADQEGTLFRFGDSESYWVLGQSIAHGEPYQYNHSDAKIFRAPVYPLTLSLTAWIEPQRDAVLASRIVGCLLGTFCVWVIYALTRIVTIDLLRLHTDSTAFDKDCFDDSQASTEQSSFVVIASITAATFAAIYPGAIGMSIFILSESIFCPAMLSSMWLLYLGLRSSDRNAINIVWSKIGLIVFSGVVSGIGVLARPSWILWPAFVFLICFLSTNRCTGAVPLFSRRFIRSFCITSLFVMGVSLAMLPWWVRNYSVVGRFVPTTLQVGASLYDSFHPGASGGSDEGMAFSGEFARSLAKERQERQNGQLPPDDSDQMAFEYALDQRLKNAAINWIKANPSDAAKLILVKFARTWAPLPKASQLGNRWIKVAEAVAYVAIMLTGIAAVFIAWNRNRLGVLFAAPCVYFAVIHCIFVGSIRYRQPGIMALCVLAGVGTAWIVVGWKKRTHNCTEAS